jgi:hypothetical protein
VDPFFVSSFGTLVLGLFRSLFTAPAWQSCSRLACGGAFATARHTIPPYLWRTGAAAGKPCSPCYAFLGCPLAPQRWQLWGAVIRLAAPYVPQNEVIRISCDDTTKKKAGTHIEGRGRYRNGAGAARQEDRTLRGGHCVLASMRIPLTRGPGHSLSVPVGVERSRKPEQAHKRTVPERSRSQLARDIRDRMAEQLPGRQRRSWADGG